MYEGDITFTEATAFHSAASVHPEAVSCCMRVIQKVKIQKFDDQCKCSGTIFQTQHVAHPNKNKNKLC
jgi:hypothetical protein